VSRGRAAERVRRGADSPHGADRLAQPVEAALDDQVDPLPVAAQQLEAVRDQRQVADPVVARVAHRAEQLAERQRCQLRVAKTLGDILDAADRHFGHAEATDRTAVLGTEADLAR